MIPPKSLKTLLYVFSRKKEDPDVLPLSPLFRDALIVSNVPKRSVVRRKKRKSKIPPAPCSSALYLTMQKITIWFF
jgi:hypothetical protein